ncbi:MAG: hypothetical protein JRI55_33245, partial [Deltaproteobacteria bacterium]|nr:hypothetical protein [Deltaproteobacteria bacterium]
MSTVSTGGAIDLINDTDDHLHFILPGQEETYVAPGTFKTWEIPWEGSVSVSYGDGDGSSATKSVVCCADDCGTLQAYVSDGAFKLGYFKASCPSESDSSGSGSSEGDGSCPYVYAHDGKRFVLSGEALVGALNRGAQRTDLMAMPELQADDGEVRVRISAVLEETDFVDHLALRWVDHAAGTRVVADASGDLRVVGAAHEPVEAVDSSGRNVLASLRSKGGTAWSGRSRTYVPSGRPRSSR